MKDMHAHVRLAFAFALAGYIFTSKLWLRWLHSLGPEQGLVVKWGAILGTIFLIDAMDPTIKLEHKTQALGVVMVLVSFNIIFNYQSEWIDDSGVSDLIGLRSSDKTIRVVSFSERIILKVEEET